MESSPITEVAVAVVLHEGLVLIGPRPAGVSLAGYWEFPGGKLDQGELPVDAAVRECLEETGVRLASLQPWETVEFDYPHGRLRLHFMQAWLPRASAAVPSPEVPLPTPHPPFRWVPVVDLPSYSFPAANRVVLEQLRLNCGS